MEEYKSRIFPLIAELAKMLNLSPPSTLEQTRIILVKAKEAISAKAREGLQSDVTAALKSAFTHIHQALNDLEDIRPAGGY
jgi:hypothetical protein